ncbi:MAG TPA: MarC family protein, partial [Bacteroidia bacterium]|nr:MarC family protein [Bacteroidia bacterium]
MILSLFITSFISLFALINPLSALPVFISLTDGQTSKWRDSQIRKTCMYIIIICISSYFIGTHILHFFGISINSLKIAGGIIISRSGFLLLNAQHKKDVSDKIREESLNHGNIDSAIGYLSNAARLDTQHAEAFNNLGCAFGSQGKLTEAMRYFKKALQLDPEYIEARNNFIRSEQELEES